MRTVPKGLKRIAVFEGPMAAITASRSSSVNRARFSTLLPYISARRLTWELRN